MSGDAPLASAGAPTDRPTDPAPQARLISVIAPCRNERAAIDAFCDSALAQRLPPGWRLEVLVADGQSDDGTRQRLAERAAQDARLRCIDNPAASSPPA